MSSIRPDWSWKPDEDVLAAINRGRQKLRGPKQKENDEMASKKKSAKKKKLDGKKLAAQRKPRDTVAQFIKDELNAGKSDVAKIIERAKADFPKSKPTPGYVRFIAKQIGKSKQVAPERKPAEKKVSKKAKKSKTQAKTTSKKSAPSAADVSPDPAS